MGTGELMVVDFGWARNAYGQFFGAGPALTRLLAVVMAAGFAALSPQAHAEADKLTAAFEKDVKESGLPFEPIGVQDVAGFKVWTSAKDKEQGKFPIAVLLSDGTVIVTAVVAHKANVKVTPELVSRLLQANYNMDFVKIGFTPDGDLTVRYDIRLVAVDGDEIKFMVGVVAKAAEAVHAGIGDALKK